MADKGTIFSGALPWSIGFNRIPLRRTRVLLEAAPDSYPPKLGVAPIPSKLAVELIIGTLPICCNTSAKLVDVDC